MPELCFRITMGRTLGVVLADEFLGFVKLFIVRRHLMTGKVLRSVSLGDFAAV